MTLRTTITLTSALVLGTAAQNLAAEDSTAMANANGVAKTEMEEIVVFGELSRYSATKSNTPILEVARSISIETEQDLIDKGALNLADAFLYTAGVFGEQYGFATRGDWLTVRGLTVPEYRDSLQALFGSYNNTRPHIYTVEQVEVLKGPASVLYGQGSPGGVVNLVSKTPKAESAHQLAIEAGSFDRKQIAIDSTGALNDDGSVLYRMIGVYRNSDTQVDYVEDNTKVLAPSFTYKPNDRLSMTLLLNYQETDSQAGAMFHHIQGTLNRAPNGQKISRNTFTGEPEWDRYNTESRSITFLSDYALNENWNLQLTARKTKGESDYRQAWASLIGGDRYIRNADGSLYKDGTVPRSFYLAENESDQSAFDLRASGEFATGNIEHEVLIGYQYQDVKTDTNSAYMFGLGLDFATGQPDAVLGDTFWINVFNPVHSGVVPDQSIIDLFYRDSPENRTRDRGIYLHDQISAGDFSISLGLRHDEVDSDTGAAKQDDSATSLSVGVLYQFENGISPYVSYAESFDPVIGVDTVTNKSLKPQQGEQIEAGVKYQSAESGLFVTLAWFDIEQSNLSNPNALIGANSQQEGVGTVKGTELEAHIPFGDLSIEVNASRLDTENADGFRFASVPETQASSWLMYHSSQTLPGFKAGLGLRYIGESYDGRDTIKTPSYLLTDLMLGYKLEDWDFALNVHNLSDKEYVSTCLARGDCFLGEKRSLVASAKYNF